VGSVSDADTYETEECRELLESQSYFLGCRSTCTHCLLLCQIARGTQNHNDGVIFELHIALGYFVSR
jgi:hypothetical protein